MLRRFVAYIREEKPRPTEMAKRLNIARASAYRALGKREAEESA